ncbi:methionine adenosyltransferase [Pedobacter cryophilus]|uniref:Methionine adenosyltransferase n=1 Tax=Pedobacter cryophilus TaxID=2571271 RepID=A0A4U1C8F3_9SPHI|nr:methionine adenosyltransferase [Pedobacter cryophilus]TKC00707.1 methionine adenosyltransferase [Pedobacter cryophilus]
MASNILIQSQAQISSFEMVERKGIGHPDTICDCIAEEVSVALSKYYIAQFGSILHHNVDKALLIGGSSQTAYKGGKILAPIEIILAGRASNEVKGKKIPVNEIAEEAAKNWLKKNIRFLDADKNINMITKIRKGSNDLVDLFKRFKEGQIPLANDSSFGVAYYPYSLLQKTVLDIELLLNNKSVKQKFPFIGEDIKVMGVNALTGIYYTIAIAIIDRFIANIDDYQHKITTIKNFISTSFKIEPQFIEINTADNYQTESIYLTVSGTSAEAGDDGEVGRGNRINGLITPYRPMSLEAVAGKNPISHIGKIYNHFAFDLSKSIVESHFADEAQVYIVSQIGKPITQPQFLHIKLQNQSANNTQIEKLAKEKLAETPKLWEKLISAETPFEVFKV